MQGVASCFLFAGGLPVLCEGASQDGLLHTSRVCCFGKHRRNYLLFHEPLLEWIVEQINGQKDTDKWEDCVVLCNLEQRFVTLSTIIVKSKTWLID